MKYDGIERKMNKEENRGEKRYRFSAIENRIQEKLKSKWMKFDPRGTKKENAGRRRESPRKEGMRKQAVSLKEV